MSGQEAREQNASSRNLIGAFTLPALFVLGAAITFAFAWAAPFSGAGYATRPQADRFFLLHAFANFIVLQWLALWVAFGKEPALPRIVGGLAAAAALALQSYVAAVLFGQFDIAGDGGTDLTMTTLVGAFLWIGAVLMLLGLRLAAFTVARLATNKPEATDHAGSSLTRTLLALTAAWSVVFFIARQVLDASGESFLIALESIQIDNSLVFVLIPVGIVAFVHLIAAVAVYNPLTRWLLFRRLWVGPCLAVLAGAVYALVVWRADLDQHQALYLHCSALGWIGILGVWSAMGYAGYQLSLRLVLGRSESENQQSTTPSARVGTAWGALLMVALLVAFYVAYGRRYADTWAAHEYLSTWGDSLIVDVKELTTDDQLACLRSLQMLEGIDLLESDATGECFTHLRSLKQLKVIIADDRPVTDDDLVHLKGLSKLKHLHLNSTDVSGATLDHVTAGLIYLELTDSKVTDETMQHFGRFQLLERLYLDGNSIRGPGLGRLPPAIMELSLDDTDISDEGLRHAGHLTGLSDLSLQTTRITGAGLKHLKAQNLEYLWLLESPIDDEGAKAIAQFTELRELGLVDTKVTDAALRHLAALSKLETLDLSGTKVGGKGLAALENSSISELRLDATELTDAGLQFVARMKQLRTLSLADCKGVTDAGVAQLADLKLETLDVSGTKITRDAVRYFERMDSLEELYIDADVDSPRLRKLSSEVHIVTW